MASPIDLELAALVQHEAARVAASPLLALDFARQLDSAKWVSDSATMLCALLASSVGGFVLTWLALG